MMKFFKSYFIQKYKSKIIVVPLLVLFFLSLIDISIAETTLTDDNYFIKAVHMSDIRLLQAELSKGISPNVKDRSERSALMIAIINQNEEMVDLFLKYKARVNIKDEIGNTALIYAAMGESTDILTKIIENKAKINLANKNGLTAWLVAVQSGLLENMKLLQNAGADIHRSDYMGRTALDLAKENRNSFVVAHLKEIGL